MCQYFIGEIILTPYVRGAPEGWLICDGSLQSIATYDTLFNLLGTTYGGDGQTTFGLPDLRGRVPVHAGQGSGLQNYQRGQTGGAENVGLNSNQLPSHTHQLSIASAPGDSYAPPTNGALATMGPANSTTGAAYASPGGTPVALTGVGSAGNSTPHSNIQPSQALNYVICWSGAYPSQN